MNVPKRMEIYRGASLVKQGCADDESIWHPSDLFNVDQKYKDRFKGYITSTYYGSWAQSGYAICF